MENLIACITFGCALLAVIVSSCLSLTSRKKHNSEHKYRIMMNGYDQYRAERQHNHMWVTLSSWDSDIETAMNTIQQYKTKLKNDGIYVEVPTAL